MTTPQTDLKPGELYMSAETILINSREQEWEDYDGLRSAKVKILSRFDNGEPSVFLLWMPPGGVMEGPAHRHYHATVTEYHFVLEGEWPTWLYDNAEQREGQPFVLREGTYLARKPGPGGLHGSEPGPRSPTGCMMLVWRDGTGNFIHEPDAEGETITVAYPEEA